MAVPRRIIPGAMYLVTRSVSLGESRLDPHPLTNRIARYCLARAAQKTGVLVHAVIVRDDSHKTVVSDPMGRLPDFLRELHRSMAKALNAAQGRLENFWSVEHTSLVWLPTIADVVREIADVVVHPIAAGLVQSVSQWRGVLHWEPGTTMVVPRPDVYFDPNGVHPEALTLRIDVPAAAGRNEEQWKKLVRDAVAAKVRHAQDRLRRQGARIIGAVRAMANSLVGRKAEAKHVRQRARTVGADDPSIQKACVLVERAFQSAYRSALEAWRAGNRTVTFPAGTWWMRVHHNASVATPPA